MWYRDHKFLPNWKALESQIENWTSENEKEYGPRPNRKIVIPWLHDEAIFYANDRHWRGWYHKDGPAKVTKGNHVTWCLVGGLFGNRCETNKQTNKQITGFCCIPFLRILQNIPVSILECPNSAGIKGTGMKKNSRPSCQILFRWNDRIPAGIRGALIRPQSYTTNQALRMLQPFLKTHATLVAFMSSTS